MRIILKRQIFQKQNIRPRRIVIYRKKAQDIKTDRTNVCNDKIPKVIGLKTLKPFEEFQKTRTTSEIIKTSTNIHLIVKAINAINRIVDEYCSSPSDITEANSRTEL